MAYTYQANNTRIQYVLIDAEKSTGFHKAFKLSAADRDILRLALVRDLLKSKRLINGPPVLQSEMYRLRRKIECPTSFGSAPENLSCYDELLTVEF
ncbi:hypothetical protein ACO2JO_19120 [Leptospira interrogans]